jgi:hypothetical protein
MSLFSLSDPVSRNFRFGYQQPDIAVSDYDFAALERAAGTPFICLAKTL